MVENSSFVWTASYGRTDHDTVTLRIWIDGQKRQPWITVFYPFHNYWHYFGELTVIKTTEQTEKKQMLFFSLNL